MAQNLVVTLLLKTGAFSQDIKTARGQIQQFQQGCSTAGKSLDAFGKGLGINIGALTKFGTVIGIAAAAGKGFKDVMESTQTTSDAFYGAIEGCKGVVEAFKISLATADFSRFTDGLWSIFDAAKAARDALDALEDAQLGYDLISSDNNANFATARNNYDEARTSAKNAKTKEERDKFLAQAEKYKKEMEDILAKEEEASRNFQYRNMAAIKATMHSYNPFINEKDVTEAAVMRAAEIFNSVDQEAQKKAVNDRAKDIVNTAKSFDTDSKRDQYLNDYDRQFDLVVSALVELGNEKIQAVVSELKSGRAAKRAYESMRRTFDRVTKPDSTNSGGGGSRTVNEEIQLLKESYSWWDKIAREKKQLRDAQVYNSESWNSYNEQLEEAVKKMEQINALTERAKTNAKYGTDILTPITGANLTGQVVNTKPSGLAEDIKKEYEGLSINELNEKIKMYKELASSVAGNSKELAFYNQQIAVLGERVKELEGIGIPEVKKETINTWDEFNSAMANTSTIVSSLTNTFKEGSELTAASILSMVSTALPALGSLISSIEALTAAEAVEAGVAATGKAVSSSKHWIEAIAAVAALGATVAAALASARSQRSQRFAQGGIVGGSSFTGDRVTAQVNSGEMILNRSQQANLFRMANGGLGGNNEVEFHISGTDLVGVLNNYNRKNRIIR
jgi:hypothetical protein